MIGQYGLLTIKHPDESFYRLMRDYEGALFRYNEEGQLDIKIMKSMMTTLKLLSLETFLLKIIPLQTKFIRAKN